MLLANVCLMVFKGYKITIIFLFSKTKERFFTKSFFYYQKSIV